MFLHPFAMGGFQGSFEQSYHAYPVSFIDKPDLENGDKIIMPPSALDRLAQLHIDYPMLFEISNPSVGRTSHCGVLEFIAEEGMVYMPYWMMQNLLLQEGDIITLKNATLLKGTYVKLQPHTKDFLDISNPKAVLETTLRKFSCLTVGDNIMVAYNNKKYYIDIVEAKPSQAISIIETDCEVDFAPPLDYKEPEPVARPQPAAAATAGGGAAAAAGKNGASEEEALEAEEPKFVPFQGSGKRLDGKPSKLSSGSTSSLNGADNSRVAAAAGAAARGTSSSASPQAAAPSAASSQPKVAATVGGKSGRLVFGSSSKPRVKEEQKKEPPKEEKVEENKFKAFSGKSFSLK